MLPKNTLNKGPTKSLEVFILINQIKVMDCYAISLSCEELGRKIWSRFPTLPKTIPLGPPSTNTSGITHMIQRVWLHPQRALARIIALHARVFRVACASVTHQPYFTHPVPSRLNLSLLTKLQIFFWRCQGAMDLELLSPSGTNTRLPYLWRY